MTDIMFPDEKDEFGIARALRFCRVCPVRVECLEKALSNREHYGIWGGMTPEERQRVIKKRGRRRPA